jgi:hypothetical protein
MLSREQRRKNWENKKIEFAVFTLVRKYVESGAKNFIVTGASDKSGNNYDVTIQRVGGMLPSEIRQQDLDEISRLTAENSTLRAQAQKVLEVASEIVKDYDSMRYMGLSEAQIDKLREIVGVNG